MEYTCVDADTHEEAREKVELVDALELVLSLANEKIEEMKNFDQLPNNNRYSDAANQVHDYIVNELGDD